MKSETRKIALACFIGGALLVTVALLVAPNLWWLGILAGVMGGYLSYEFREVLRAIPPAYTKAKREGVMAGIEIKEFFSQPHPIGYLYTLSIVGNLLILLVLFAGEFGEDSADYYAVSAVLAGFACMIEWFVCSVFLMAYRDRTKSFFPGLVSDSYLREAYRSRGMKELPYTYTNVYGAILIQIIRSLFFAVWWPIKWIPRIVFYELPRFSYRFGRFLFIAIHSYKRLLCAVDGTIGGLIVYFNFARQATSIPEQILLVVFGGLLGAGLGILNWELISVRVLRVAHVRA